MTDAEVQEMRIQIAKELETDPMDGGIVLPDAGDGITRYPQDGSGGALGADDVAKLQGDLDPTNDDEKKPEDDEEPVEDDFDKSLTVKGKKK